MQVRGALWAMLFAGCGGPTAADAPQVCPAAEQSAEPAWADANHDARVDVADAVHTLRWLNAGGQAPACEPSANVMKDELIDMVDGLGVLYSLFVGDFELPKGAPRCPEVTPLAPAVCGGLAATIDAPSQADSATFNASVSLRSDLPLQAWSFGVAAEGCKITAVEEAGTAIADVRLDPDGKRDKGFVRAETVKGGAIQGALLSWQRDVTLAPQATPSKVFAFTVEADLPASGCTVCRLTLADDLKGPGEKVARVAVAYGRSYDLPAASAEVQVCAP